MSEIAEDVVVYNSNPETLAAQQNIVGAIFSTYIVPFLPTDARKVNFSVSAPGSDHFGIFSGQIDKDGNITAFFREAGPAMTDFPRHKVYIHGLEQSFEVDAESQKKFEKNREDLVVLGWMDNEHLFALQNFQRNLGETHPEDMTVLVVPYVNVPV